MRPTGSMATLANRSCSAQNLRLSERSGCVPALDELSKDSQRSGRGVRRAHQNGSLAILDRLPHGLQDSGKSG